MSSSVVVVSGCSANGNGIRTVLLCLVLPAACAQRVTAELLQMQDVEVHCLAQCVFANAHEHCAAHTQRSG
jgi:hypothetical protein